MTRNGTRRESAVIMNAASDNEPAGAGHVGKAIRSAVVWNFATMAFGQVAIASVFLLLAGKIDPVIFGTFALAAVLIDIFYNIGTASSVDALVQQQDYSRRTLSTVTWAAMGFCAIAAIIFVSCAGWYANAVGAPQVAGILEILSLTTLMIPFVIGPMTIMRERLDFKGIAVLGMISSLTGSLAALAVAYSPYIEWALVVQRIVMTLTLFGLATIRTRFLPSFEFDLSAARTWLSATSRIFAGQSFANTTPRLIDLLMGIFFGVAAVGHLRVALKLYELAISLFVNPFTQLWVVLLTRARESKESISGIFVHLNTLLSLIALPGFIGLALIAREVVAITLKPEYAPVADMLMVLGALGFFVPLNHSRNAVLTATRQFNSLVQLSMADMVATIVGMVALSYFGAPAMLGGLGVSSVMLVIVALPIMMRATHTKARDLFTAVLPPYVAVIVMAAGVLAVAPLLAGYDPIPSLIIKVAVGATIYLGVLGIFFRRSVIDSFKLVAAG